MTSTRVPSEVLKLETVHERYGNTSDLRIRCTAVARLTVSRDADAVLSAMNWLAHELREATDKGHDTVIDWEYSVALWDELAQVRTSDSMFLRQAASWVALSKLTTARVLRLSNRLSWTTRSDPSLPDENIWRDHSPTSAEGLFLTAAYLQRRRMSTQYHLLPELLDTMPEEWRKIPLVLAFRSFSLMISNDSITARSGFRLLEEAWKSAEDGMVAAVRDVLLHGLDGADALPDRASIMLHYCESYAGEAAIFGYNATEPVARYRHARALRYCGRGTEALAQIDLAFQSLGANDTEFVRTFREQCLTERTFIQFAIQIDAWRSKFETSVARIAELEGVIEERLHSSTLRSAEVLGIFTSAVAFAVGGVAIGTASRSALSSVLSMIVLGAGLLGFSWVLTFILNPPERVTANRRERRLLYIASISSVASLLLAASSLAFSLLHK